MQRNLQTIHAEDGISKFSIAPEFGAMGTSLILPFQGSARECLYLPDNFWQLDDKAWSGGLPICFPICGRLTTPVMPMHGFAPYMPFEIIEQSKAHITLLLKQTPQTLKQFPYAFEFELQYAITPGKLSCTMRIQNNSDVPMPFYAGFHPYFLTAATQKDQIQVNFKAQKRLQYNDSLTDIIGELPALNLPKPINDATLNEQLSLVEKNQSSLHFPDGSVLKMTVNEKSDQKLFNFIQMYTRENESFFCIEPWMNFPNALNYSNDLHYLNKNCSKIAEMTIILS